MSDYSTSRAYRKVCAQAVVLVIFIVIGLIAVAKFRPVVQVLK
jgi:Tfp pilus assembly protein PilX